jgi:hypothetical protein
MENLTETPSVLRYSDILKVGTPIAEMNYHRFIPSNGATFTSNQSIRIPFNVPVNAFCNLKGAYLKMTVNNLNSGANDAVRLDPQAGIASFIDTWRVVSGTGGLLEEVIHYNAIYALMTDLTGNDHTLSTLAIMDGSIEQTDDKTTANVLPVSGATSSAMTGACQILKSSSRTCTHVPMSGLFQTDRLVPFGFANGTAYVEIVLPTTAFPLTNDHASPTTATLDWSITNVELHCPVLRMGAEFNASFRELLASGMPISWHGQSYTNVQSVVSSTGGASSQSTITLASRKRSVKSIFSIFRLQSDLSQSKADSASARQGAGITQWSYELGGVQYPVAPCQQSASNVGETYANLVRCLNNLGNSYAGSSMNRSTFLPTNAVSKIAYGIDLESYGHSDVQSGKNLSGQGLPIVFRPTITTSADQLLDCYLLHDVVYTLDGVSGTISASS